MKYQLFLCLLLCTSGISLAQPTDNRHKNYMEQLEKDRKAYTQEYLDALRYNRNSTVKSGAGSADQSQNLADIVAARAGRETAAQKAAREKQNQARYAAYQQQQAAWNDWYRANSANEAAQRKAIFEPRYNEYLAAGFEPFDAQTFGNSHVNSVLSADKQRTIYSPAFPAASIQALEAFQQYKRVENTAGFEELFDLITDFNGASYTALLALQRLEKRFPEKKEIIAASYLFQTASVWGRYEDFLKQPPYHWASDDIKKQMLDIFGQALATQPSAAIFVSSKASADYNPIKLMIEKNKTKESFPEAVRLATILLQTKPAWGKDANLSAILIRKYSFVFTNPKYRANTADIKKIAEVHQLPARKVVEWMNGISEPDRFNRAYYFESFRAPFTKNYFESGYDQVMKELGEQGDGDALNTYAIGVAFGESKDKPKAAIELWNRAAALGSGWAMFNLFDAARWKLKWYSDKDLPAAKEKLKSFKPATPADKSAIEYYFDVEKGVRLRW